MRSRWEPHRPGGAGGAAEPRLMTPFPPRRADAGRARLASPSFAGPNRAGLFVAITAPNPALLDFRFLVCCCIVDRRTANDFSQRQEDPMLGPRPLLLCVVICLLLQVGCISLNSFWGKPATSASGTEDDHPVPLVQTLLTTSAKIDPEHESHFFRTLAKLSKLHGSPLTDDLTNRSVNEGYAVRLKNHREVRIVVILCEHSRAIPGFATRHILLLDREGRTLDRLSLLDQQSTAGRLSGGIARRCGRWRPGCSPLRSQERRGEFCKLVA
jgi:hypothetical protein